MTGVVAAGVAVFLAATTAAAQSDTVRAAQHWPKSDGARTSHLPNVPLLALAAISAASFNQAIGAPKGWTRTWGGYGRRVGDQVGFAVVEETVRLGLGATVSWVPDTMPCQGRTGAGPALRLSSVAPRLGCAVRESVVLRNQHGVARPNFPLGVGTLAASAASALWRPDAGTPSKALTLIATRVAVVFGATVASRFITDWRDDRR